MLNKRQYQMPGSQPNSEPAKEPATAAHLMRLRKHQHKMAVLFAAMLCA
jgi:hypothetical protein